MRVPSRAILVLLCLFLAVALCPQPPHEFPHSYDRSYLLALSAAHAQGVVFGTQLNYPYGPLGYLIHPLPISGAVGAGFAVQLAVFALFIAALALLARRVEGRGWALWSLVVIGAAALIDPEALWLAHLEVGAPVVAVLAFATAPARRLPVLLGLAVLSAALLLVKLDAGVYAIVLCAALALRTALQRRADGAEAAAFRRLLLAPPAVFLAALSLLFLLESGRVDALPAYLLNAVPVLVGYKEMSTDGYPERLIPALVALGVVFLQLPLLVRDRRRLAPALLMILVPAFMLWQRVAMRQDEGHQVSFLPRMAVLMLIPLLALKTVHDRVLVVLLQVLMLAGGAVVVHTQKPFHHLELLARVTGRQALQTATALAHWEQTRSALEAESDSNGVPLRLGLATSQLVGDEAVDAVPYEIERVMANGWRWAPRPALQSSNAYMPALERLDGEHFAGDGAPRFVLASAATIDGRHIFQEAPLTWRALLDRYDLRASFHGVLLLERRSTPRLETPRPLGTVVARWDQEIEVPDADGFVLLSCRIAPGLAGRVAGLFYRNAAIQLGVRYRSGLESSWRVVRPNFESGAIVSHLPTYFGSLHSLFESGPGQLDRAAAIRFHTEEPWQFEDSLELQWSELPIRVDARPWRAEWRAPEPMRATWSMLGEDCARAGALVLSLVGEPRVGQPIEFTVAGGPPAGVVGLMVGAAAMPSPGRRSRLFVDPQRMLLLPVPTDETGANRLRLTIPTRTRLAGRQITLQAAAANGPGAPEAWRLSCGIQIVIGN